MTTRAIQKTKSTLDFGKNTPHKQHFNRGRHGEKALSRGKAHFP